MMEIKYCSCGANKNTKYASHSVITNYADAQILYSNIPGSW